MADNELDKSIEELEAEVLAELELEEANGQDAPAKSGAPADKMDKVDGEVQDTGKAVVDPEQKDAPAKKVAAKAKEVGGQAPQKGEGKPDKMDKLAAGDEIDHDGQVMAEAEHEDDEEEKEVEEEMPKNGKEAQEMMLKAMKKMSATEKKDLYAMYMKNAAHDDDEEDDMDEVKKEAIEQRVKEVDVAEHVEALVNGEGDLSEEFKRKAATVFEAAVKSKIRTEIVRLENEYEEKLKEDVQSATEEMTDKVDTYLNYVTEEWMKENEIAVERGLKGEIAEDFISGLKQLFEDHYIDVPDEKYDVLEAQSEKIAE